MLMRRALCVGIDEYPFGSLSGCVSDANRMAEVLTRDSSGNPNFDCRTLAAPVGSPHDTVTRSSLRAAIDSLFRDPADVALLHFSGHGTANNLDGFLVTQDAKTYDEGVSMADVLKLANASKVGEIVIMLDCCYSGNLGSVPGIDNSRALLREGISILTAGRGDQPSVETNEGGLFTSLVVDALEGGAADILGNVTAPAIYSFVEAALGAWEQRPLFKSHVARLVPLRCCTPPIEKRIIHELPVLFPVPAEDLRLDPTYESTSPEYDPKKGQIFSDLQSLVRVHLVEPVDAQHMYDAAMQSKACRLTPTGRYYWRLANSGRV